MEEDFEKTVSVYSQKNKKNYNIIICTKEKHLIFDLNSFNKDEVTFGRANDNDIVIKENIISSHHGKFIIGSGLKVIDNDSMNGLFINGELKKEYDLSDGDIIKIDNPNESLEQATVINVILGDLPKKCPNCKKELEDKEENKEKKNEEDKKCPNCNAKISDKDVFCQECGAKIEKIDKNNKKLFCSHCGEEVGESIKFCPKCGSTISDKVDNINDENNYGPMYNLPKKKSKAVWIIVPIISVLLIAGVIIGVVIHNNNERERKRKAEEEAYNNLPVKIDISMTSYYGHIDYILEELGLDFDLVTMGANCYTGVQSNTFDTKKYGKLHTEFRYCKANSTQTFRVYNTETDQKLREPKAGEVPKFDSYGYKTSGSGI